MPKFYTATIKYTVPSQMTLYGVVDGDWFIDKQASFSCRSPKAASEQAKRFIRKLHGWYDVDLMGVVWSIDFRNGSEFLWGYSKMYSSVHYHNTPYHFYKWLRDNWYFYMPMVF